MKSTRLLRPQAYNPTTSTTRGMRPGVFANMAFISTMSFLVATWPGPSSNMTRYTSLGPASLYSRCRANAMPTATSPLEVSFASGRESGSSRSIVPSSGWCLYRITYPPLARRCTVYVAGEFSVPGAKMLSSGVDRSKISSVIGSRFPRCADTAASSDAAMAVVLPKS